MIWSSKKPTGRDLEATSYFLSLRRGLGKEFLDKKHSKNSLWLIIANDMKDNDFFVGDGYEGAEKCRKKFANLQATYIKYKDKSCQPGQGYLEKPPFFDEMDEILGLRYQEKKASQGNLEKTTVLEEMDEFLGKKEKVVESPKIMDSFSCSDENNTVENQAQPSTSQNKFVNINNSTNNENKTLLRQIIDLQKQDMEDRKNQFNRVMNFIETTALQRHEQFMALINKYKVNENKRKSTESHNNSSSESES